MKILWKEEAVVIVLCILDVGFLPDVVHSTLCHLRVGSYDDPVDAISVGEVMVKSLVYVCDWGFSLWPIGTLQMKMTALHHLSAYSFIFCCRFTIDFAITSLFASAVVGGFTRSSSRRKLRSFISLPGQQMRHRAIWAQQSMNSLIKCLSISQTCFHALFDDSVEPLHRTVALWIIPCS